MLHIYLLGGFRVEIDSVFSNRPETLLLPKVQGLVELWAYLLLHSHRPIQRDQLAFMLWPDESEESARRQLRSCLHKLGQLLPVTAKERPWLTSQGRTVRWNPDADYWLDVDHFRQASENAANGELRGGYDELTLEQKIATLELYSGDLLPELNSAWLLPIRMQLHNDYLGRLDRLVESCVSRDEAAVVLSAARKAAQVDPYSEVALRRLMKLRYLVNDRVGALRQLGDYLAFLKRSRKTLRLSPETLALRRSIASGVVIEPLPEPVPLMVTNGPPPKGQASNKAVRLLLTVWLSTFFIISLLALLWYYRPFSALKTLTLRGPEAVQGTWITSTDLKVLFTGGLPCEELYVDLHDGRGWIVPQLPFSQYPAWRINLGNNVVAYTLMFFRLDELPARARVEKAILTITLESGMARGVVKHQPRPITVGVFRLLRPWQVEKVTFSSPWSDAGLKPGIDYDAQPLSQQALAEDGVLILDLTGAFPAWQNGQNYGVILMAVEAPAGMSAYWILSSHHPDPAHWPELTVQYR